MANNCMNYITFDQDLGEKSGFIAWWQKNLIDEYERINSLTELDVVENKEASTYQTVGTKWIIESCIGEGQLTFDSAWTPAKELFFLLSKKFNMQFDYEYSEPGCSIGGFFSVNNGEILDDDDCGYIEYCVKYDAEFIMNNPEDFTEDNLLPYREHFTDEDWVELQDAWARIEEEENA